MRFDFNFPGKVEIATQGCEETDTLCVWYKGYCENIAMPRTMGRTEHPYSALITNSDHEYKRIETYAMGDHRDIPSTWGNHAKNKFGIYLSYGIILASPKTTRDYVSYPYSDAGHIGLYYLRNVTKNYGWGISLENGTRNCNVDKDYGKLTNDAEIKKATVYANQLDLEFYQHFRLSSGYNGLGCALEIGIFGSWIHPMSLNYTFDTEEEMNGAPMNYIYKCCNTDYWDYGLTMRVNYSAFTLFAKVHSNALFGNTLETMESLVTFDKIIRLSGDRNIEFGLMMKF